MRLFLISSAAVILTFAAASPGVAGSKTGAHASGKTAAQTSAQTTTTSRTPACDETTTAAQVDADATVSGAEVVVPGRLRPQGQPISPLPNAGVTGRGSMSGGVGVTVPAPLSSNRQPAASNF
jgi:hypothetical protein